MSKLDWIDEELKNLREAGLYNHIRTLGTAQGAWLEVDGRRVLNFCSNNYLGLANHPRLIEAVKTAMVKYGVGPGAVRTIAGTMDLHVQFDERMAKFKGVDKAISLQSGFTANLAVIPALVGKEDAIVSDALSTAIRPTSSASSRKTGLRTAASWWSPMACSAWTGMWRRWTRFTRFRRAMTRS